jgi:carbon-monoxide dehydrogenase medium subunit
MAAADFMQGAYQTALAPGEILAEVELPAFTPQMRWGYYKICTKVGEFASALGAVVHDPGLSITQLLVGAVEARPLLVPELAGALDLAGDAAIGSIATRVAAAFPQADEVFVHQHAVALARAIAQMEQRQSAA